MTEFRPKIVVASHVNSEPIAVPKLVKSLIESGVPSEDILVVVGGCGKEGETQRYGVRLVFVTHNSYDHTGLIYLLESNEAYPWWWSMHDTTEAGKDFYRKICAVGGTYEHIAVGEEGWLNMGLFSMDFLQRVKAYVLALKNCSKLAAILSERVYPRLTQSSSYAPRGHFTFLDHKDVYGDGAIRRVIYYQAIDLYKYQSFYLEKQQTLDYLRSQEITRKFHREQSR